MHGSETMFGNVGFPRSQHIPRDDGVLWKSGHCVLFLVKAFDTNSVHEKKTKIKALNDSVQRLKCYSLSS